MYYVPRAAAGSDARPFGMQTVMDSILTSGNILSWRLVIKKIFYGHSLPIYLSIDNPQPSFKCYLDVIPLIQHEKGSCQLLANECALSAGKLRRRLAQEQCG